MHNYKNEDKVSVKPLKFFGSILTAGLILFGAAACNEGNDNNGSSVVAEEQYGQDETFDTRTEDVAVRETAVVFEEWDENADQRWDRNEFDVVAYEVNYYTDWDTDEDGTLSEDELNEGLFRSYDEDNDYSLSSDEFYVWNSAWGMDNDFNAWDANQDEVVDQDEFGKGNGQVVIYEEWDADRDGVYSQEEVNEGLYSTWDADDDGYVNSTEYHDLGYNLWGL